MKGNTLGELILTLEPSGFEPGKDYRTALAIKDEKATYTTDYTEVYVVQTVGVDSEDRKASQQPAGHKLMEYRKVTLRLP